MQSNCRYDKLNTFIHIQNQRSHYKRIFEAKKCINFQDKDYNTIYKLNSNPKYKVVKEKERKQNNYKLVNRINQINHTDGILESMHKQAKASVPNKVNFNRTGRTTKYEQYKIYKDNVRISRMLKEAKPKIGTISQWKNHFKTYKSIEKRIQKANRYDNEQQLRSTISSLSKSKCREKHLLSDLIRKNPKSIISSSFSQCNQKENQLRLLEEQMISIPKINEKQRRFKTTESRKNLSADFTLPHHERLRFKNKANSIMRTEPSQGKRTERKIINL